VSHTSSAVSVFIPGNELVQVFGEPALVAGEKLEDYERLFATIRSALNPPDAIGWLFAKDFTDWSWEIRRERTIKDGRILRQGNRRRTHQVGARSLGSI